MSVAAGRAPVGVRALAVAIWRAPQPGRGLVHGASRERGLSLDGRESVSRFVPTTFRVRSGCLRRLGCTVSDEQLVFRLGRGRGEVPLLRFVEPALQLTESVALA